MVGAGSGQRVRSRPTRATLREAGAISRYFWVTPTCRLSLRKPWVRQEHAFSILPTFAVAIPVRLEARSPASDALAGGGTVSGVAFRYSPMSYWVGVSIGFGVMAPSTANLDRELFKSPKLLTLGGGVTVLGNLLSVGIFRAWLYTEGYMSTLGSSATYLNIELDLSALGLAALGAAK